MSYFLFILFAIYCLIILIKKKSLTILPFVWLNLFGYYIGLQWKGSTLSISEYVAASVQQQKKVNLWKCSSLGFEKIYSAEKNRCLYFKIPFEKNPQNAQ